MRGDHIYVRRLGYTHHGLEVDNEQVVHFTGEPARKRGAAIQMTSLSDFLGEGGRARYRRYGRWDGADAAVERALSRVGESRYALFSNNCEHFATWCCIGRMESSQVTAAASTGAIVTGTALSSVAGVGIVSTAGVTGLSGAGIMSGLATVGGTVGAGAVGGLAVLGAAPGAASVLVVRRALRDDDSQPIEERAARTVGRGAAVVGAGAGTVAGVTAVSAGGAVAGLSAAGISSGLAAVGAAAGGGMAAGVGIVVAGPALLAGGIGYGAYRIARGLAGRKPKVLDPVVPADAAFIDFDATTGEVLHVEPLEGPPELGSTPA